MAQDGLLAGGDVTATSTGVGVAFWSALSTLGGVGQLVFPNLHIISASSNSVDCFIDISGPTAIATTSASYRLRPGKSFPPYVVSAAGRATGYTGFSCVVTAGSTSAFLYWGAWR